MDTFIKARKLRQELVNARDTEDTLDDRIAEAAATAYADITGTPTQLKQFYYQATAPSHTTVACVASTVRSGDYWIDSDDNKLYLSDGSTWAEIQDNDIGAAQALIDDIGDDAKITAVEKLILKPVWDAIVTEATVTTGTLIVQAATFSVSSVAYASAYATLYGYIITSLDLFNSYPNVVTTDITRADWDTNWNLYYDERTDLIILIEAAAATLANWSGVTNDDGTMPDDFAGLTDSNLVKDPSFLGAYGGDISESFNSAYWYAFHASGTGKITVETTGGESNEINILFTANSTLLGLMLQGGSLQVPCKQGDVFYVKARIWQSSSLDGSSGFAVLATTRNISGTFLSADSTGELSTTQDSWVTANGTITITHADAVSMQIGLRLHGSNTAGTARCSYLYISRSDPDADVTADQFSNDLTTIDAQIDITQLGFDSSGNLITSVLPASNVTPDGTGLYLGADYLGYYTAGTWTTYMDNTGAFYLGGTSGKLQWDGAVLAIDGSIDITGVSTVRQLLQIESTGTLRSNTTGTYPYLEFSNSGLQLKDADTGGTYGTATYTTAAVYGFGATVWLMNAHYFIPWMEVKEPKDGSANDMPSIRFYDRSADPTGGTYAQGDVCVVGGKLMIYTGGVWAVVGDQTA